VVVAEEEEDGEGDEEGEGDGDGNVWVAGEGKATATRASDGDEGNLLLLDKIVSARAIGRSSRPTFLTVDQADPNRWVLFPFLFR
jgi:hypothetical protein